MNLTAEITLSVYTLFPLRLPRVATKYIDNKFIIIIINYIIIMVCKYSDMDIYIYLLEYIFINFHISCKSSL